MQGSTDLANWHALTGGTKTIALTATGASDNLPDVSVDGWPWVRVRYMLTAPDYNVSTIRAILLTATLSAAG